MSAQRVKVQINGHQFYEEFEGDVLMWGQTVTYFDGKPMQVPCVIVDAGSRIIQVPLQCEARMVVVKTIGAAAIGEQT